MANTSSRTLRLLSLLQTHRFWPGPELADRLEVSDRTLRRDVERLRELGYPVRSSRGVEGGYQLGSGGSMPPLVVNEEEAIALVVALGRSSGSAGGALADASLSALAKVVQVLPPHLRRRAEALRAVTVDARFGEAPEVTAEVLATLAQAARDGERVRFVYRARGGQVAGEDIRRLVEPHRLVTVGRRWYLVGYDVDRQDWRSFRLDRLRDPIGTKTRFRMREVPGGDAAAYVRQGFSRGEEPGRVVVRAAVPAGALAGGVGPWGTVLPVDEQSCRVMMEVRSPEWAVFGIGALGVDVVVEEASPAVRDALAGWATRLGAAALPG